MKPIYLLCGVSGTGKTWVCKQLTDKFHYVPHDLFYQSIVPTLLESAKIATKPVITECPFGERVLREELESKGLTVIPIFVIEDPMTVAKRFLEREGRPLAKNVWTRASTIRKRAEEWKAPQGTSKEMFEYLRDLPL